MLIKNEDLFLIYLEIYEISEEKLVEIDDLEQPFGFEREKIENIVKGDVWIYYYTGIPPSEFSLVKDGNFRASKEW